MSAARGQPRVVLQAGWLPRDVCFSLFGTVRSRSCVRGFTSPKMHLVRRRHVDPQTPAANLERSLRERRAAKSSKLRRSGIVMYDADKTVASFFVLCTC